MNAEQWMNVITEAYKSSEIQLTDEKKELLHITKSSSKYNSDELKKIKKEMYDTIWTLFWKKAVHGETFGDLKRVEDEFNNTLENNYGLKEGPFINMARTYWTFKIEIGDLFEGGLIVYENSDEENSDDSYAKFYHHKILKAKAFMLILSQVECDIASIFFPMPGPVRIPVVHRRETQRKILEEYAHEIDIERFLTENPILKKDEA